MDNRLRATPQPGTLLALGIIVQPRVLHKDLAMRFSIASKEAPTAPILTGA
jgi:hypothetical protein